jgi:uncharacterized protein YdeI (BOF family)
MPEDTQGTQGVLGQQGQQGDFRRRMPSVSRKVSELAQNDIRVSVVGTIIDVSGGNMVLDDGTGKVNISFENPPDLKTNQLVRVFGRVMPADGWIELQGELAQPMEGLDLELRRKAEKLLKSV